MKKKSLYFLTLFFSLCLLFFSCRKEISFVIHDRDYASKEVLQSAKLWYQQHIDPQASKIKEYGVLPVYWEKAWTKNIDNGNTILVVPAEDYYLQNPNYTFKRFLTFKISNNQPTNGKIIELVGKDYDVDRHFDFLTKHYNKNSISGFNGTILQYDVNYQQTKTATYTGGERKRQITGEFVHFSNKQLTLISRKSTERNMQRKSGTERKEEEHVWPTYNGFPDSMRNESMLYAWHQVVRSGDSSAVSNVYTFQSVTEYGGSGSGGCPVNGTGSGGNGSGGGGSGGGCQYPPGQDCPTCHHIYLTTKIRTITTKGGILNPTIGVAAYKPGVFYHTESGNTIDYTIPGFCGEVKHGSKTDNSSYSGNPNYQFKVKVHYKFVGTLYGGPFGNVSWDIPGDFRWTNLSLP